MDYQGVDYYRVDYYRMDYYRMVYCSTDYYSCSSECNVVRAVKEMVSADYAVIINA